jgi:Holliday junction resolvase RusA-like endonuclease
MQKKREFRDRMIANINNIVAVREVSRGRPLSVTIRFYLYSASAEEGRAKKDLDNLLKPILDTLPDHMDRAHTESGLGLMVGDSDHLIFEVNAVKKLVTDPKEEGIEIEIFEWND